MTKQEMIKIEIENLRAEKWGENCIISLTIEEAAERSVNNKLKKIAEENERKEKGIVTMLYSEYKNNYSYCKTVANSYDKKAKTIDVITKSTTSSNGLCKHCGSYCYGDCQA